MYQLWMKTSHVRLEIFVDPFSISGQFDSFCAFLETKGSMPNSVCRTGGKNKKWCRDNSTSATTTQLVLYIFEDNSAEKHRISEPFFSPRIYNME